MFSDDIEEQGKKLMQILTTVVRSLKQFDKVEMAVWQQGRRHEVYGVKKGDFDSASSALLWTLQQGLQHEYIPEVEEAWVAAYTVLASIMQGGADYPCANFDKWKSKQG